MQKITKIIEEKYYWVVDFQLALLWSDLASQQGTDDGVIAGYWLEKVC